MGTKNRCPQGHFVLDFSADILYIQNTMDKTYKYRIYPTNAQRTKLNAILEECRWLWNHFLELTKTAWEERQESLNWYNLNRMLPSLKNKRSELKKVHSQVLQEVGIRLDKAFKAFFRRIKQGENPGYPRFKGKDRLKSFTYPQSGFKLVPEGKVYLSKVGRVKINLYRPVPSEIKQCIVKQSSTGKWFVCFVVDVESLPLEESQKATGIDVGLTSFATLSDGTKVENPRFFRKEEKALAKAQRKLSAFEKGTPEYRKKKKVVTRIHERIANKRMDFAHKLSREWVNSFGIIAFEGLNIKQMQHNHCLAKSISDAAWGQLISYTSYKAEEAGRKCILVNPKNTSKMCSRCGTLVEKSLGDRVHVCPQCGLKMDRDQNAAINILRMGLHSLGSNP